jgi:hypothetical protein
MQGQDQDQEHDDEEETTAGGSSVEKAGNEQQEQDDKELVSELFSHDVLLGRGTGPNEHQGNKHLRSIVAKFQKDYDKSPSRKGRHEVAMKTLREIKKNKGRFLERAASANAGAANDEDSSTGNPVYYFVVDDKKAINKIKQAFRYNIQTTKYTKRMFGESLQEEFHDNKRTRLSEPTASSPAGIGGGIGFDGVCGTGLLGSNAHAANYRTNTHPSLSMGQQFLQHHQHAAFARGNGAGLIRDPIPPSQLARLDQGLARLDQRLVAGGGIGAARSMMEYHHAARQQQPLLYAAGLVGGPQPSSYEQASALAAASRIAPLGAAGVSPFLSSLGGGGGVRSPLRGHYPLGPSSPPGVNTRMFARMPGPTNEQLLLARDILLPPSAAAVLHRPSLAAAYHRPLFTSPLSEPIIPDRRAVESSSARPSDIRSLDDAGLLDHMHHGAVADYHRMAEDYHRMTRGSS